MNNKGMIVLCIVAIVALVGWLAALAGRETIEDMAKEIKFLRSENARLEKVTREKEPSTAEAVAALTAKCRRHKTCMECERENEPVAVFCNHGRQALPEDFPRAMADADSIGVKIENKVKAYMEAQS